MENFSVVGANGWQKLSTLLAADTALAGATSFLGKYLWSVLIIRNTSANTMIIKTLTGATAPATDSGINLTASGGVADGISVDAGNQGVIDGNAIWVKCSAGSTGFDITFVRKGGQ